MPKIKKMLQISYIRENKEEVISRLKVKNIDASKSVEGILTLDWQKRTLQKDLDDNLAQQNQIAKQIGDLFKSGNKEEAEDLKKQTSTLKEAGKTMEETLALIERDFNEALVVLPNLPHKSVPPGRSPEENEIIHQWGDASPKQNALPHWELTEKHDIIDFETGNKITGAGFPVYKGKGAKLQRALINFFLDRATLAGYLETQPPILVNEETAYATGQLPDKEGQMYFMEKDGFYLIPTAEVPLTNIYRNVILKESDFPVKMCGYTPCFRREAGSYGKDVRGLNRLHQFDKVEIVQLQHPSKSYEALEDMKNHVAGLIESLGLPYRILRLCGGDMSFASALTYDLEVYSAAQQKWLEVSSVSNFETFQSNRLKLRFKDEEGKMQLAHTLNGSALALPRIVAALLENNQTEQGINIPPVLIPYTGFDHI